MTSLNLLVYPSSQSEHHNHSWSATMFIVKVGSINSPLSVFHLLPAQILELILPKPPLPHLERDEGIESSNSNKSRKKITTPREAQPAVNWGETNDKWHQKVWIFQDVFTCLQKKITKANQITEECTVCEGEKSEIELEKERG